MSSSPAFHHDDIELPLNTDTAARWHTLAVAHGLIQSTTHFSATTPPLDPAHIFDLLDGTKLFQMKLAQCPIPVDFLAVKSNSVAPPRPPDLDTNLTVKHLGFALLDWRDSAQAELRHQKAANKFSTIPWDDFYARADAELSALIEKPREYAFRDARNVPADVPCNFGVEGFCCAIFWLCVLTQAKEERRAGDLAQRMSLQGSGVAAPRSSVTARRSIDAKPAPHQRHMYDAAVGGRVWREALAEVLRPDAHLPDFPEMERNGFLGDALARGQVEDDGFEKMDEQGNRVERPPFGGGPVQPRLRSATTSSRAALPTSRAADAKQPELSSGSHHHRRIVDLSALVSRVGGSMKRSACVVLSLLVGGAAPTSETLEHQMMEREQERNKALADYKAAKQQQQQQQQHQQLSKSSRHRSRSGSKIDDDGGGNYCIIDDVAVSIDDAMHILCVRKACDLDDSLLDDLVNWCTRRVARWLEERFSPLAFPSRGSSASTSAANPAAQHFRPYLLRSFFRVVSTAMARVMTRIFASSVTGGDVTGKEAWTAIRRWTETPQSRFYHAPLEVAHADFVRVKMERTMLELAALPVTYANIMHSSRAATPSSSSPPRRSLSRPVSPRKQHQQQQQQHQHHIPQNVTDASSSLPLNNNNSNNDSSAPATTITAAAAATSSASVSPRRPVSGTIGLIRHRFGSALSSRASSSHGDYATSNWSPRDHEQARTSMRVALATALQVKNPNVVLSTGSARGGEATDYEAGLTSSTAALSSHQQEQHKQRQQQQHGGGGKQAMVPRPPSAASAAAKANKRVSASSREGMREVIDADHGELSHLFGELRTVAGKLDRARMQQLLQLQSAAKGGNSSKKQQSSGDHQHQQQGAASARRDGDDSNNSDSESAATPERSTPSPNTDKSAHHVQRHQQRHFSARRNGKSSSSFKLSNNNDLASAPLSAQQIASKARFRAALRVQDQETAATQRQNATQLEHRGLSVGAKALLLDGEEFFTEEQKKRHHSDAVQRHTDASKSQPIARVLRLTPREGHHLKFERDGLRRDAQCALHRVGQAEMVDALEREDENNRRLLIRYKRPVSMQTPADLNRAALVAVERARAASARARAEGVSERHHVLVKVREMVNQLLPIEEVPTKRCTTGLRTQEYYGALNRTKEQLDAELSGVAGTLHCRQARAEMRALALQVSKLIHLVKKLKPVEVAEWEEFNVARKQPAAAAAAAANLMTVIVADSSGNLRRKAVVAAEKPL